MSYAYELADEAMAVFRQLETWLAEEFLDEMERLVANPPPPGRKAAGGIVGQIVRDRGGDRFYVFFTLAWTAGGKSFGFPVSASMSITGVRHRVHLR